MSKLRTPSGGKNLISQQLIKLRKQHQYSQRDLACLLQLAGYDIDNIYVYKRQDQRYVNDLELKAFSQIFNVSYEYLIEGKQN